MEGMAHEIARFPQACMRRACEGWVSNPGAAGSRFCQGRPRDIAILGKSDAQELNSWSLADSHSRGPEVKCMAARPDAHDLFHLLGGIDQELHGLNSQYSGRIGNGLISDSGAAVCGAPAGSAWHPADMRAVG